MEIAACLVLFLIPRYVAVVTEHTDTESHTTSRQERFTTGPVDRPTTREEALAMRGSGWDGNLDQMCSGHADESGDTTDPG